MNRTIKSALMIAALAATMQACKKDDDNVVITPASEGKEQTLNGGTGGSAAVNSVFLDFSTDKQDSVLRTSWDLAFTTGSDFRVVINNTTGSTAKVTTKTDLAAITTADTTGFAAAMLLVQGAGTFDIVDDVDGDLTKTAIAAVSATDAENKVYIVKPTNGAVSAAKDWYKVRILRNGAGYKLQYAKLSETVVKTVDISKDAVYNFNYFSLETNAVVKPEPAKANWDIEWTASTYKAATGATSFVPYVYSDLVYINYLGGVTAAEVLTTTVSFDAYAEANVATTTFTNSKTTIADKWRATPGAPGSTVVAGVKTDRFYVIKDPAGNVYKLKFLSFIANDLGVRGYPKLIYKLVKKA